MPYIKQERRNHMVEAIDRLCQDIDSKGDLNYAICEIVGHLIINSKTISYTNMSEFIDAVHDAECELRRRLLEPYENEKMNENGDVPSFEGILERLEISGG
jgi:hypothetical protein